MNINDFLSSTNEDSVLVTEYTNFRNMFNQFCSEGIDLSHECEQTESLRNQLNKINDEIQNFRKIIQDNGFEISDSKFYEHIYSKFDIIEKEIPLSNGN